MLIRNAERAGQRIDLRIRNGRIAEIGERLDRERDDDDEIDAGGGAILPGLHDHHLHLLSLAASLESIPCGPPRVSDLGALREALRRATPIRGWLRGTGYFESVAGPLDRHVLDALRADHPLRIQHRSGSMWFLNSRGIEALGLDADGAGSGIERDASGRATGRLFRADDRVRRDRRPDPPPDLAPVGALLSRCGVTRVTDATPSNGRDEAALFEAARRSGALPQKLRLMGGLALSENEIDRGLQVGEVKLLYDERALPDLERVVASIREAHAAERSVAIHTVTRTELHFALAAIEAAGSRKGDRLEHASVAPPDCMDRIDALGLGVVTQPNFVAERGDAYRVDVDERDRPHLYRVRSWLDRSIPLAAGTDAPFGDPDPWRAMRAAVSRETALGHAFGKEESVSPETAFGLFCDGFLRAPTNALPSGALAVGRPADLCLLDAAWRDVRHDLSREHVAATFCGGRLVWPPRN